MQNRKTIILAVSLILVTLLFAFVTFKPQAQNGNQQQEDPPTRVQIGVMTEKQRKHSKMYNKVKRNTTLISQPGDVTLVSAVEPETISTARNTFPTQAEYLQALTCGANSVVIAKVRKKDSQLTENLNFIFTDYELDVELVIKNDLNLDIQALKAITLHTIGGSVKVDNRIIKYELLNLHKIHVGGEYLLFLNYLHDSDSYKLSHDKGIFDISGDKIKTSRREYIENTDNLGDIINLIRSGTVNCSTINAGK